MTSRLLGPGYPSRIHEGDTWFRTRNLYSHSRPPRLGGAAFWNAALANKLVILGLKAQLQSEMMAANPNGATMGGLGGLWSTSLRSRRGSTIWELAEIRLIVTLTAAIKAHASLSLADPNLARQIGDPPTIPTRDETLLVP